MAFKIRAVVFEVTKESRISGERRVSVHVDVIKSFRLPVRLKQLQISGTNFCDFIIRPITGPGVYGSQKFLGHDCIPKWNTFYVLQFSHKSDDFFSFFPNKWLGTPQNCYTPTVRTFRNFCIHQPTLVIQTGPNIAEVPYFPRNWIKQSFPPELAGADTCRLYKCL
jgi:hypothetical protein